MRFAPETLLVFLAATASFAAVRPHPQDPPAATPSASPEPQASPSPTPRYKLIPYGFESAKDRSTVPLLRFEDKTEVRSLEMNAAIARFFDGGDDKGNMLRGATPGGAPTRADMSGYRPNMSPSIDLIGAAVAAIKEIRKQIDKRKGMPAADPSPTPSPSPTP